MKWNKDWEKQSWVPYTIAVCSGVLLYLFLTNLAIFAGFISGVWSVIAPLFIGVIFAYLMDPIARFLENKPFRKMKNRKAARQLSVVLSVLFVVAIFVLLIGILIPPLVSSMAGLVSTISSSAGSVQVDIVNYLEQKSGGLLDLSSLSTAGENLFGKVTSGLSAGFSNVLEKSYSVGSGVVTALLGFILAIYYMMAKDSLQSMFKRLIRSMMPEKKYVALSDFCYRCDKILLRYILCDLVEALVVGLLNGIFMLITGMPYISLISVVVGVTNLAPTFGPLFGAAIGAILLLLVNPWYALWFLIFTVVLQTVDGYILKPKLFGDTLGVSSLLILITIIVGGRLFGVLGILLAIPFAAIAEYFVKEIVLKKAESKKAAQQEVQQEMQKEVQQEEE